MSYKKRAREGWETGKHHKKIANQSERMFAKEEIRDELNQMEAGEEFREKGSSRKKTRLEKLTGLLVRIEAMRERSVGRIWTWLTPNWYNQWATKVKEKIGRLKK
jgi:hypothetical protein